MINVLIILVALIAAGAAHLQGSQAAWLALTACMAVALTCRPRVAIVPILLMAALSIQRPPVSRATSLVLADSSIVIDSVQNSPPEIVTCLDFEGGRFAQIRRVTDARPCTLQDKQVELDRLIGGTHHSTVKVVTAGDRSR